MGLNDHYVASLKGTILSSVENPTIVDISHSVRPFDIAEAAYLLSSCYMNFPDGTIHMTTIINMDEAMWGTSGMIKSEIESNKEEFPDSTFVLDKDGVGNKIWALGKKGGLLAVIDKAGSVLYLTREAISEQGVASAMAILKEQTGE